ncbi:MAG: penicillin-binding protein 1A [Desulfobacterales bacterium]|uniref:Penicillin-binding protein 1A n=1 Tax=Candidatus Desulfaltia bathyphila TaxID=2841697 RepID=A0A8J6N6Y0_9BACT|nr:penicillin-binding protein 1A [Candidatus Desulfaltia bathyphila]MBL7195933.1 penicillin-binding protein 1A [Desulfobacterales bacterium]MBL7207504.1 penicillin-binding protein 1A [Desulfobacterales bacterium]
MESKNRNKAFILFILIAGVVFGAIAGAIFAITSDFPQIRSLETYRPPAVTRIYSADKKVLAELFVEKRDPVPLKDIPFFLKEAIVATEDRNFYQHSGVDLKGILRAAIKDILAREFVEGASTITQQLAKTLFLTSKKTLMRKIKEAVLSFQLERRYTKDEILQMYLNQVYFGSGAYGVESAARIFFGKAAKDLGLSECALIAAMPKAPSRYSPLINKELALKRRDIVLKQMKDTGIITASVCDKALKEPVVLGKQNRKESGAGYFVEYVKSSLEEVIGSSRLYKGGLTVYTTLSFKLQKAAEDAVANGLIALEARMKSRGIKDPYPQGALIALDVRTGGILAMVGGRDFSKSPFNRAVSARRQPGSAFKPIVYAYAIEQGFPQSMMILDAPVAFKGAENGKDWTPENFSGEYMGEITLRTALAVSENIPAVRLTEMLGPNSVARFGRSLGIESPFSPDLSLALGTSETTLIDLTSAYAVFPNRGERIEPFGVTEVLDGSGRVVWQVKPQKRAVMSRAGAAIMTDMLSSVIQEGTGRKARVIRYPVAGKTGTTNQYKDALFIGFSPSMAAGVWVGRDVYKTLGNLETGARAALPIWIEFMTQALADSAFQYFDIPDNVVKVRIDPITGLRASDNSTHTTTALFKKGTEPMPHAKAQRR